MKIRFASWNVNNRILCSNHFDFLYEVNPDILALQEVNPKFSEHLTKTNLFSYSTCSLHLRPPGSSEGRARQLGCALFSKAPFKISTPFLLNSLPFPERALIARISTTKGAITACSFHTPPGASWKELKPKSHKLFAEWLVSQPTRLILGIDANAPKTDHPDIKQNDWWWKEEPLLLGDRPIHSLKDAFRLYLEANPVKLQRIRMERPKGPLAISYIRGNKWRRTMSRYDFIYVTPDISISSVEYLYEASVKAGSDHALVIAEIEVTDDQKM
ncbi:endonuclease/exonuclease/phosphatase family protein [Nitrosomonas sp. Nm34]|uniref:endonuclease/exonuclease/phosphatase family protein n=1 Tax=Nitrosomonas sp. Nm34 TaxID=1881055 RepID=UPI0008F2D5B4|nr:endonuclease/exonuclease/phosphatase family protein [Nitrosomonas sp. Nm34]SFI18751.1 Exonuclease III [Nitrosomonas sp. Nm34]